MEDDKYNAEDRRETKERRTGRDRRNGTDRRSRSDRRSNSRLVFKPQHRPILKVGNEEFDVENISEGGIKFRNEKQIKLDREVSGTITFYDGDSIDVYGRIVWESEGFIGVCFKHKIPTEIVMKDEHYVNIDWE